MRRFAHIFSIVSLISLFVILSAQAVNAANVCSGGGLPQEGRGGAVGDKCNVGPADECCKIPDGDPKKSLTCDTSGPTQGTCILVTNFGQEGQECINDDYCNSDDDLQCVNKKCKKIPCVQKGGACGPGLTDNVNRKCCTNTNLVCGNKTVGSPRGTCIENAACKKANESCTKNSDCCTGQHLTCDINGSKKCESTCLTKGETCSSTDAGAAGSCCDNQGLSCDIDRIVDPSKPAQCVTKDDIKNVRDHGDTTPVPTLPPPPSPPCSSYADGKCIEVVTAFGKISTDPTKFIANIYGILLAASGGIAVLLIMRAGYKIQTSQGKQEAIKEGQEQITAVVVGMFFLVFAFVLLQVIASDLLKIPGITP